MRVRLLPLIILSTLFVVRGAQSGGSGDTNIDETLEKLFEAAKRQDTESLARWKGEVERSDSRIVKAGYAVALYMTAPGTHKRRFVRSFPDDRDGIAELFDRIESMGLTPGFMYSVAALGDIAAEGDRQAIGKIIAGSARSDGAVAVAYGEEVVRVMRVASRPGIEAGIRLSDVEQGRLVACFEGPDVKDNEALEMQMIEALRSAGSGRERDLIGRIIGILRE